MFQVIMPAMFQRNGTMFSVGTATGVNLGVQLRPLCLKIEGYGTQWYEAAIRPVLPIEMYARQKAKDEQEQSSK